MKRYLCIFCFFLCLFSLMIIPVQADELPFIDLLSEGYLYISSADLPDSFELSSFSESVSISAGSNFKFNYTFSDLPGRIEIYGLNVNQISCSNASISSQSVNGGYYLSTVFQSSSGELIFSANSDIEIISVRYFPLYGLSYVTKNISHTISGTYAGSKSFTGSGYFSFKASDALRIEVNEDTGITYYIAETINHDIKIPYSVYAGRDYVDVRVAINGLTFSSATCFYNGAYSLPIQLLSLYNDPGLSINMNSQLCFRIDVRSVFNYTGDITLNLKYLCNPEIGYNEFFHDFDCYAQLLYVTTCNVYSENASFFSSVINSLESLRDAILSLFEPNSDIPDDFNDSVATHETIFDEYQDVLDQVTRPDKDEIDPDITDDVSASDLTLLTSGINGVLSEDIFLKIFVLSLTICLVAYILYGKR